MRTMECNRKVVLADGSEFYGQGFGGSEDRVFDIVYNTSMVGYQEVVSDPTYARKGIVMTYPIIGSCGMADDDFESRLFKLGGLIVREYNDSPSNFRCTMTLADMLEENGIPGLTGADTRAITRHIRDNGSMRALITSADTPKEEALAAIEAWEGNSGIVKAVSCRKRWYSRTANHRFSVAAVDCGIRLSFIKGLSALGCNVTVLPYDVTAEEIVSLSPDGVFISNGPGAPEDVSCVAELIRKIRGSVPVFGVGLGNEALGLAYGAKTVKLKDGHHGGNVPVRDLINGGFIITDQRHDYAVSAESVEGTGLKITHENLIDGTVEGLECVKDKAFAVQFHPEVTEDPKTPFGRFIAYMKEANENA